MPAELSGTPYSKSSLRGKKSQSAVGGWKSKSVAGQVEVRTLRRASQTTLCLPNPKESGISCLCWHRSFCLHPQQATYSRTRLTCASPLAFRSNQGTVTAGGFGHLQTAGLHCSQNPDYKEPEFLLKWIQWTTYDSGKCNFQVAHRMCENGYGHLFQKSLDL